MECSLRISERWQITIPKALRDRYGLNRDVEVEVVPAEKGLLIQKRAAAERSTILRLMCCSVTGVR